MKKKKKSFGTVFNSSHFLTVKDHLDAGTSNKRHANHIQALQENSVWKIRFKFRITTAFLGHFKIIKKWKEPVFSMLCSG